MAVTVWVTTPPAIVAVKEVLNREEGFSSEEELMDAIEPVFKQDFRLPAEEIA